MLVKAVSSISIHQIWILRITGFSSRILFPHIFGFLCQNWEKISAFALLNHGRAYAIKKSIASSPFLSRYLYLNFGSSPNSREPILQSQNKIVLDNSKCSGVCFSTVEVSGREQLLYSFAVV
jgi:hypothetical protein